MKCPVCFTELNSDVLQARFLDVVPCPECGQYMRKPTGVRSLPIFGVAYLLCSLAVVYLHGRIGEGWWFFFTTLIIVGLGILLLLPFRDTYVKAKSYVPGLDKVGIVLALTARVLVAYFLLPFLFGFGILFYHQYLAGDILLKAEYVDDPVMLADNLIVFDTWGTDDVVFNYQNHVMRKLTQEEEEKLKKINWAPPEKQANPAQSASGNYTMEWDVLNQKLAVRDNRTGKILDWVMGGSISMAWWGVNEDRLFFLVDYTLGYEVMTLMGSRDYSQSRR